MKKLTQQEFIDRCVITHDSKYSYNNTVYTRMHDKIVVTCPIHGDYLQLAKEHVNGAGCKRCGQLLTTEEFIDRAVRVHGHTYDYSEVVYTGTYNEVLIKCPKHGVFAQMPNGHLQGLGCRFCAPNLKKDTSSFVQQASRIHNNFYDYSKTIYTLATNEITITCPVHGDFQQVAYRHLQHQGCSMCGGRASKPALEWLEYVATKEKIEIRHRGNGKEFLIPGTRFSVDGYCEATNTVYEFHGDYWHGNPTIYDPNQICKQLNTTFGELYARTVDRETRIKGLGYNIVVMWESEWNAIKDQTNDDR